MKYFSKKVTVNGETFDSQSEYQAYLMLKEQEKTGLIRNLRRQTSFVIIPKLFRIDKKQLKTKVKEIVRVEERESIYTTDFCFYDDRTSTYVMLEVKGGNMTASLPDYVLRRKLIKRIICEHNKRRPNGIWEFRQLKIEYRKRGKKSS